MRIQVIAISAALALSTAAEAGPRDAKKLENRTKATKPRTGTIAFPGYAPPYPVPGYWVWTGTGWRLCFDCQ